MDFECLTASKQPRGLSPLGNFRSSSVFTAGSSKPNLQQNKVLKLSMDCSKSSFITDIGDGSNVDKVFKQLYPLKIALIGSGNWACAIAYIIGNNVITNYRFQNEILMYVYEEYYESKKLSTIINETHENPKYLPGHRIPDNIKACSDIETVVTDADLLMFVLPHQFLRNTCNQIKDHVKSTALALSLIKGFLHDNKNSKSSVELVSSVITSILSIPCDVMMGANIANEVANGELCEATLGSDDINRGYLFKSLLQAPKFHIRVSTDKSGVEVCGAAKNVVAIGVGMLKGINQGYCAQALLMKRGMIEMLILLKHMLGDKYSPSTIIESCGLADIVASCDQGRNAHIAEEFVRSGNNVNWEDLERTLLNGQKLQGVQTSAMLYEFIANNGLIDCFPLFVQIQKICIGQAYANTLIDVLRR
ncbi:hypothetical protein GJ496_007170 [Pomphorhynchus laevis]|nr:hypothetical protein GJ496_007170 [Pomphorhynchus laevis]